MTQPAAPLLDIRPALGALVEPRTVAEAKDVRDKAAAVAAYAREAKDRELLDHAVEVRLRAERRAGELLRDQAERGERAAAGNPQWSGDETVALPTLADLGVTKKQSSYWQRLAAMNDEAFLERLTEARRAAWGAIDRTPEERQAEKRERRAEREAELGERQAAMPDRRYGVLLVDPPWRWEPYSRETGMDRAADNHYPTMTNEEIAALEVPAADDCVLFLWATNPMLLPALVMLARWGFVYKTNFVWTKDQAGTGYWNRERHELLLVGVKGVIPAPAPGEQFPSVIVAPRSAHSAKPPEARSMIAAMFPTLPKLELFARGEPAEGWDAWGNEAT